MIGPEGFYRHETSSGNGSGERYLERFQGDLD